MLLGKTSVNSDESRTLKSISITFYNGRYQVSANKFAIISICLKLLNWKLKLRQSSFKSENLKLVLIICKMLYSLEWFPSLIFTLTKIAVAHIKPVFY